MKRRHLIIGVGVLVAAAPVSLILGGVFAGSETDERARRQFGIPKGTPVNVETLAAAAIRLAPVGTAELDVRRRLEGVGIGKDGPSRYSSPGPGSEGLGVVAIGADPKRLRIEIVVTEYIIFFEFDSNQLVRQVRAERRFVGP